MKMIIAGGRDFKDLRALSRFMETLKRPPSEVVCGMARGADLTGKRWADGRRIPVKEFPARWEQGKAAGFHRNTRMAEHADALLAFWDGISNGTSHMIEEAERLGLYVKVVYYNKEHTYEDGVEVVKYTYDIPELNRPDIDLK